MSNDNVYEREGDNKREVLKAAVEAKLAAALEQASVELTEVDPTFMGLFDWAVIAIGPFQTAGPLQTAPGRIIELGETAYIATIVMMNHPMCRNVGGFGGKVQLSYFTANTQTMLPVNDMEYVCCIQLDEKFCNPAPFPSFFVHIWEFKPTQAACILETNICARICNCKDEAVPHYAGFVRWVYDLDAEWLWPAGPRFDHPIRYLVYDDEVDPCDCSEMCD